MDTINNPFLYVNFSKNDYIVIVIGGKNTKGYVVTRVRNCDSLKTKTTQSILLDPESAKQHIRKGKLQCYQYKHYTDSSAGLGKLIFVLQEGPEIRTATTTGVYSSINWPPFTGGQNSILKWVLKLNPLN